MTAPFHKTIIALLTAVVDILIIFLVDYILKDQSEKERLHIKWTPRPYPQRIVRAPVPWASSYKTMKEWNNTFLFNTNTIMLELQNIWHDQ